LSRRLAREKAMQALFAAELGLVSPRFVLENLLQEEHLPADDLDFAGELIDGCQINQAELDRRVAAHLKGWDLKRLAAVDRNVLRLGAFELLYRSDIPSSVTINEAVELAKRFGDAEAASFVNGVLDRMAKELVVAREAQDDPGD